MESLWDLQESLKHEKGLSSSLASSVRQWQNIIDGFSTETSNITNNGTEWKVRYECQKLYNQMLQKHIQRMRAELRMMRYGVQLSPFKGSETETVGELRTRIRNLRIERCSIKSLRDMYDTQLDLESAAYYRACQELERVTKDVSNGQTAWIRDQERADHNLISSLQTSGKSKRLSLKPIAKIKPLAKTWLNTTRRNTLAVDRRKNPSYTNMFLQHRSMSLGQDGYQGFDITSLRPVVGTSELEEDREEEENE